MNLVNGDCLVELQKLPDKSIDFFYLDLPYGQTACAWDKKVDLEALWVELIRLGKSDRTAFFFSCTTKFGYELIKSKEKYFRWDLVWEKNRASGFLNAYRLPLRKHEMIYCFSKKSPAYDVSSHNEVVITHQENPKPSEMYNQKRLNTAKTHKKRLPTSVLPAEEDEGTLDVSIYGDADQRKTPLKKMKGKKLNGKLPTSVLPPQNEVVEDSIYQKHNKGDRQPTKNLPSSVLPHQKELDSVYGTSSERKTPLLDMGSASKRHEERLPTSVLPPQDDHELVYCFAKKCPEYDTSSHNEICEVKNERECTSKIYALGSDKTVSGKIHTKRLPTSILPDQDEAPFLVDEDIYDKYAIPPHPNHELIYCFAKKTPAYDTSSHAEFNEQPNAIERHPEAYGGLKKNNAVKSKTHKERLPTSILPVQEEHELIYCFAKKSPAYDVTCHLTGTTEHKSSANDIYLKEAHGNTKDPAYFDKGHKAKKGGELLPTSVLPEQDNNPSSWCKYNVDSKTKHRTSKPVPLMEFLLKYWTKEGDVVCDPTAGAGSMAVACQNMNRQFVGMEMNEGIYNIAIERLADNAERLKNLKKEE